MTRLSLITVTYQSRDLVADALRSAERSASHAGLELEVIVVDNASADGSADVVEAAVPAAIVVRNAQNVGFGRACNQGFALATGDWWMLLNPDATLDVRALAELVAFASDRPVAGAVAPMMEGAGTDRAESAGMQPGIRAALGHFLLLNRLLPGDRGGPWRGIQLHRRPAIGPRAVDWASAGALLVRPEAVRAVRGFDESFFLYAEDVDLGRRLAETGWRSWLIPQARVHHAVAASSGGISDRWFVALHDYHGRRSSGISLRAFDLIAFVGLALRYVAAAVDGSRSTDTGKLHARRMRSAAHTALTLVIEPRGSVKRAA